MERRKGQNHTERGSEVEGGGCTGHARKGGVIEKISVACGGSGGIGRHRRSCADRTGSHKRSFLVDAGTYIGHPKTWVEKRAVVGVVVGGRTRGWVVPGLAPRRGRSRQADAFVALRNVGQGDERTYWKLEGREVSGEEKEGEMEEEYMETDKT